MAEHLMIGDHAGMELVDQTLDNSIIAIRAQQQQQMHQQQLRELVDGGNAGTGQGAGLAAPDGNQAANTGDDDEEQPTDPFKDTRIIYNSIDRGACYHAFAWMWCGCFEPKYKITASYTIGEEWESCCLRVTDSMAYENVDDVQRQQGCCWCMLSYSPCCPCFNDMADIVLMGSDESHSGGWKLKRIHRSKEVFDILTRTVQATNKSSKPKK